MYQGPLGHMFCGSVAAELAVPATGCVPGVVAGVVGVVGVTGRGRGFATG
jgi:hypothetical protein